MQTMKIDAFFLNPAYCEGRITADVNAAGILLTTEFAAQKTGKEILGVIARKFSGHVQPVPVALTEYLDILGEGDTVKFTGQQIEVPELECSHVVSAFIRKQGKILLLKRSDSVGTFRGMWATVSGYIEGDETPLFRARKEILEEIGIKRPKFLKAGRIVLARSGNRVFAVHPFLFETDGEISLDWEHTEYRWIAVEEINHYNTVPKLTEALLKVI
ncbi:MAG: NUDIX domain-containing protein [Thermoplasmata archaeon]|nr:NUDIX domain-containing protein [Thermoplasmata archaeon]